MIFETEVDVQKPPRPFDNVLDEIAQRKTLLDECGEDPMFKQVLNKITYDDKEDDIEVRVLNRRRVQSASRGWSRGSGKRFAPLKILGVC